MKLLVIGCGSIGKRHVRNAGLLAEVGVYDEDKNLAKLITKETGANNFESLKSAFKWSPDGVIIATPTHTHTNIAKQVIESGFDVLIEKPISNDLGSADNLIEHAKKLKRNIFIVCNMRFHEGVVKLTENLQRVGKPLFARAHVGNYLPNMRPGADYRELYAANKSMGGGVVLDAIHEIDYLINFFGPVKDVKSTLGKLSNLEIDVEDYAEIILIHDINVYSSIHMDYLRPFKRRGCEIVGDGGMLLWQSEGKNPENCSVKYFPNDKTEMQLLLKQNVIDTNKMYQKLIQNFCNALNNESHSLLLGSQALDQLRVIKRIKNKTNWA